MVKAVARVWRFIALPMLLLLLRALPLGAQVVRGLVVEEGSGRPVQGAMVVLLDASGRTAASTLSDASGAFVAEVDRDGRYHARVDRIGYESLTTELFDVPKGGTFRRIAIPVHPVELGGLDVSGSRRCRLRVEAGRATLAVWEEARKALEAAAWTAEYGRYRYTLVDFDRHLDRDGRKVLHEDRSLVEGYGQATYVGRPARELADSGYVREAADGNVNYFVPDADVLLSDAFLDTHCLRVQKGEDGLVGLAFEPVGGRMLPDIRGVLWMDQATARLTRLEFRYVNLKGGSAAGDAGGEVAFERLPAGTWIVHDWRIRMPLLGLVRSRRYQRIGYEEEGSTAWRVLDPSGAIVQEEAPATVVGVVMDSLGKAPLAGATVVARGLRTRAVSDATGAFTLSGLPAGRIDLGVSRPGLDTLGLAGPEVAMIDVGAGDTARVRMRTPGVGDVLARACEEEARPGGTRPPAGSALVFGRVREAGRPVGDATVGVGWSSPSGVKALIGAPAVPPADSGGFGKLPAWRAGRAPGGSWLEATLDHRGTFLLCGVTASSQVRVQVVSERGTADTTVSVGRDQRLRLLTVDLRSAEAQPAGVVRGQVVDSATGDPVSVAAVSLVLRDSLALVTTSTGADGRYRLPVLDSGTFRVRVERSGYRTSLSVPVRVDPHEEVRVDLRLLPAPLLLDSILVDVRRARRGLREGEQLVYGRLLDDDTGEPIPGGTVRLLSPKGSTAATVLSNDNGQFWLVSPRAGAYRLQAERIGYRTAESPELYLMLGDSVGLDFRLSTQAVLLAPITVTASRRAWSDRADLSGMEGFFSRYGRFARSGYGGSMTRDSIAYWEKGVVTVGEMLMMKMPQQVQNVVPLGVGLGDASTVAFDLRGAVVMRGQRFSGGKDTGVCIPQYYLNGARVPYVAVSDYGPQDLEAVEVYVAPQIPAEFSRGFPCGVVGYWTRRSPGGFRAHRTIWTLLTVAAGVLGSIVLLQ